MNNPTEIRAHIKYRLQIMQVEPYSAPGEPYSNAQNVKGKSFPVCRIMLGLVVVAIIAVLKGW